jgi:hypothetical protein
MVSTTLFFLAALCGLQSVAGSKGAQVDGSAWDSDLEDCPECDAADTWSVLQGFPDTEEVDEAEPLPRATETRLLDNGVVRDSYGEGAEVIITFVSFTSSSGSPFLCVRHRGQLCLSHLADSALNPGPSALSPQPSPCNLLLLASSTPCLDVSWIVFESSTPLVGVMQWSGVGRDHTPCASTCLCVGGRCPGPGGVSMTSRSASPPRSTSCALIQRCARAVAVCSPRV